LNVKQTKKLSEWQYIILASAVVLTATALILLVYTEATHIPAFANITVGRSSYNVYLAVSPEQQERGLMNATSIGDCGGNGNCVGMLFVNTKPPESPCFWMKDTIMPLNQYWISNNEISYVWTGVPNSTRVICSPGDYVLETNTSVNFSIGTRFSLNSRFD
jgi:uncharacterized membrane protein (UPF0127 family)